MRDETRETLRELERQTGERQQDLLHRAVDQFRRNLILAETNTAYARLRAEGDDLDDVLDWDGTVSDGLGDD